LGEFSPIGRLFSSGSSAQTFGQLFFRGKSYVLIWARNGLGYTLGDFLANSSGHPDWD
jgi:hypothetical protein